jgi:hypothetical protein
MRYEIKATNTLLKPYVKHLVISDSGELAQVYQVLLDTSLVIEFQYMGKLGYIEVGE